MPMGHLKVLNISDGSMEHLRCRLRCSQNISEDISGPPLDPFQRLFVKLWSGILAWTLSDE